MKVKQTITILSVSDMADPDVFSLFSSKPDHNIDLILSCGDLQPEFLTELADRFKVPLYYVCGNHDIRYAQKPPGGGINLHRKIIKTMGLTLLGFEGSRWYNGGPYQYTENQMRIMIRRLWPSILWHKRVDIVITHAPPRYIGDASDPCHKGFKCFARLIDKYKPRYFIHGHIHHLFSSPAERVTFIKNTKVINTYGYHILEIKNKTFVQKRP